MHMGRMHYTYYNCSAKPIEIRLPFFEELNPVLITQWIYAKVKKQRGLILSNNEGRQVCFQWHKIPPNPNPTDDATECQRPERGCLRPCRHSLTLSSLHVAPHAVLGGRQPHVFGGTGGFFRPVLCVFRLRVTKCQQHTVPRRAPGGIACRAA